MPQGDRTPHRPLGVPLDELESLLAPTSLELTREDRALVGHNGTYQTRVEVSRPETRSGPNGPIRAVVRVTSDLPASLALTLRRVDFAADVNRFSSLGALIVDDDLARVGCRLTMYEREDAWRTLQLPLLLFAVIGGAEGILGGLLSTVRAQVQGVKDKPAWTASDIRLVERYLSRIAVCNADGLELTAEFGLEAAATSAIGGHRTALLQVDGAAFHPSLGRGLLCVLQMPDRIDDKRRLAHLVNRLNQLEMESTDLPPHFGAWCIGKQGNNPAYVTFLPNAAHAIAGVAVNLAVWSAVRARWAGTVMAGALAPEAGSA